MNKKSLTAIERIISCISELNILTKNKTAEYFYDGFGMNVLIDLISEIEFNLNKISQTIKVKYKNVDWDIIESEKFYDEVFGESLNLRKIWQLSSKILEKELLESFYEILEKEIPIYYERKCTKNHKKQCE